MFRPQIDNSCMCNMYIFILNLDLWVKQAILLFFFFSVLSYLTNFVLLELSFEKDNLQ